MTLLDDKSNDVKELVRQLDHVAFKLMDRTTSVLEATEARIVTRAARLLEASVPSAIAARVMGVGRVEDNPKALLVIFKSRPHDNDIRALHDHLAGRSCVCTPDDGFHAANCPGGTPLRPEAREPDRG